MHPSPEGLRSYRKFIVLETMSVLILLPFNTVTNWNWGPSSLQWLSPITGDIVSLCHPAQIKGVKEGKLESDVLKLKIMPAKAKLCRDQWHHNHRRLCPHLCAPSNYSALRAKVGRTAHSPFPNMTIFLTISQCDFFTGQTETLKYFSFILRKAASGACRWQGEKHVCLVMWPERHKPHLL